ncbi:MAG: hypothetical protein VB050_13115 [Geobacteraceae bacterium]|nr:hypothetical protein [Geobacteraceae bacterium]
MKKRIVILLSTVALLGACETMRNQNASDDLQQSSKMYNRMIRWDEMESAQWAFPTEQLREEFGRRVESAKGVKVSDYRVKSTVCSPEKGEATVIVEFEYYREPSYKVKTVRDVQKWKYVDENGKKIWRLMTLLPEFP